MNIDNIVSSLNGLLDTDDLVFIGREYTEKVKFGGFMRITLEVYIKEKGKQAELLWGTIDAYRDFGLHIDGDRDKIYEKFLTYILKTLGKLNKYGIEFKTE